MNNFTTTFCCSVSKPKFSSTIFLNFILILLSSASIKAQVVINEIMAYNTSGILSPDVYMRTDWIELHNAGPDTFDLTSCSLSDERDDLLKWSFPPGMMIDSGDFLVVWADNRDDIENGLHAGFKLKVAGETIYLTDRYGDIIDSLTFIRQFEDVSYGKTDTGFLAYFSNPTPGAPNDEVSSYRLAVGISYNPPPGIYHDYQFLELSWVDSNAVIHYTLDGSEPDENSDVYVGPIGIPNNTVIRTKIWADGYIPGWIETATYLISDTFTLPVFSLVTDPVNLWDDIQGIYTIGTNGIIGYCSEEPRNWNQEWERPVSLEYFGKSGLRKINTDGGIKIHGGCSRQAPMKSLAFFARNEYGNNELRYPFFREKEIDRFKDLIFRNSGNDFWYTMIRDGMIQAVAKGSMDIDGQAFEPVQVFLNGEYWGIHNLREDLNEHYLETNYNISGDDVDILKWNNYAICGTNTDYISLENFMASHDLSVQADYDYVADRIDINEYINYLIIEMFFANLDWPGNNVKYWRQRSTNGKWRWMLFDLDFTLGIYDFNPAFDMFTFTAEPNGPDWPNPPWSTFLYRNLLENQGFRDLFVQKFMMHLNTTLKPANVIHVIDSLCGIISNDFPAHIARWNEPWSMEQWNSNVEQLRTFAHLRPDYVWQTMRNFFSLGPEVYLSVDYPDTAGKVMVNDFLVPPGGLNGRYLSGLPLNIQAFPAPGNKFIRWDVTPSDQIKETILPRQSVWKYSDTGIYPGNGWNSAGFDNSSWPEGQGELGYGDGLENTILYFGPDSNNKYITYYFRKEIEIENLPEYSDESIFLMRDDGAVVYINGKEVLRVNLPDGNISDETLATTYAGGGDESTYFEYHPDSLYLQTGTNIIAVEIHQSGTTSSDISFDMEITSSYFIIGDTVPYEGSHLSLTPTKGLTIHPVFSESVEVPHIVINEFMATNQDAYEDEFGEYADWIELFNLEQFDVNTSGFYVTDNLAEPFRWQIPDGFPEKTTLPAGGYIVLFADKDTLQGPLHLDIKLGAEGEEIGLSVINNNIFHWLDTVSYGTQTTDVSLGRFPDGAPNWEMMTEFTPGATNQFITNVPVISKQHFRLYVYPNPAEDITWLQITGLDEESSGSFEINLYDLTGRIILNESIRTAGGEYSGSIELSKIPQGFYILKVGNDTEQISTRLIRK
jgi:hypothetical protein